MTTESHERIPELTLGWRLKMALGGMKRSEMAELLGYEDSTLSRWMNDKGTPPRRGIISQWAMATNVSLRWLETGEGTPLGPPPGEETESDELAALTAKKRSRAATRGSDTHRYVAAA